MKLIINFLQKIINQLKPPRTASWQTFVLSSILIWLLAYFTPAEWQNILAYLSWIFLIIAAGWFRLENPIPIGSFSLSSWGVGALVCIFIFHNSQPEIPAIAIVFWPAVSAIITVLPELIKPGPTFSIPEKPERQKLVILILIHLLVSCWLQFNFLIQSWLQQYPSLLTDNFSQSTFVVKIDAFDSANSRGNAILGSMEIILKKQIDNKPWDQVENWFTDKNKQVAKIAEQVIKDLPKLEENMMWTIGAEFPPSKLGYNIELVAKWQGLGSLPEGYHLKKFCWIVPVGNQPVKRLASAKIGTASATVSNVECKPVSPLIKGQPKSGGK